MSALHCETTGAGPVAMTLLHGWSLNLRVFDSLAGMLGDVARSTAVDLPGHGRSPVYTGTPDAPWPLASVAAQVLTTTQSADAVLLGWSLGGQIAITAAALHPERVRALVLICASARFVADDAAVGMPPAVAAEFGRRLLADPGQAQNDFLELQVRGSSRAGQSLVELRAALQAQGLADPGTLRASLETLFTTDLRELLPQVRVPALVIAGQYDRVTHPLACRQLAENLPDARFVELPRAGHAPFLSHTVQVADLVREFVLSLS